MPLATHLGKPRWGKKKQKQSNSPRGAAARKPGAEGRALSSSPAPPVAADSSPKRPRWRTGLNSAPKYPPAPPHGQGKERRSPTAPLTSPSNGGFDEGVQLFVAADGELQVPGGDALYLEILRSVACQLQHLARDRQRREPQRGLRAPPSARRSRKLFPSSHAPLEPAGVRSAGTAPACPRVTRIFSRKSSRVFFFPPPPVINPAETPAASPKRKSAQQEELSGNKTGTKSDSLGLNALTGGPAPGRRAAAAPSPRR